jgi:acyl-coenzyme A thioesterase PaaI-like protein
MTVPPAFRDEFAPLKWATQYLDSPNWVASERIRGIPQGSPIDIFCRETIQTKDTIHHWLELYEKPTEGTRVNKSLTLCKFGSGFNGFPGIAHGGAMLAILDEALGFIMVANETLEHKADFLNLGHPDWRKFLEEGRPLQEVLQGRFVTAKLDVKFLRPVISPGIIGVEVEMLEHLGNKMKMRGVMKDENGIPLMQVDGLWVRIGAPKL